MENGTEKIRAYVVRPQSWQSEGQQFQEPQFQEPQFQELQAFTLGLGELTDEERQIILKGCLINYNRV